MGKNYKHLSLAERIQIEKYLDKGYSAASIGSLLKRSASTITREIQKCRQPSYSALDSNTHYAYWLNYKNYGLSKTQIPFKIHPFPS